MKNWLPPTSYLVYSNLKNKNMLWKLLRQHISVAQLAGFFFANLCGMIIVLLSIQFYKDVMPAFTQGDSFMKKDFIIVSKKVSTLGSLVGKSNTFSENDMTEIKEQPFTVGIGAFKPTRFRVSAGMGMQGMQMSTDMFFESVPDRFVDVKSDRWAFDESQEVIPIIVPRNYLNLYNFGFAQSRNLPKLSEGVVGMVNLTIRLSGNGQSRVMKGNIVGFSNRLNTILVPEAFIDWANKIYGTGERTEPSRLIVEVNNPADERIARFLKDKGYDTEGDKADAGKTAWFLKVIVGIVMSVGLLISVLSFYILILSIYLLLQKNTKKLENLLLIGYSPARVALPYQLLAVGVNLLVLLLGLVAVGVIRGFYKGIMEGLFPDGQTGGLWPACLAGGILLLLVTVLNVVIVRRKIDEIWMRK